MEIIKSPFTSKVEQQVEGRILVDCDDFLEREWNYSYTDKLEEAITILDGEVKLEEVYAGVTLV